ncbi:MAG: helix-turn-helix domain-containing protein [Anaerolineae bacterium]|nr:helix-turn-helix domain-containing protein [Anaerolineae bacterium]
MTGSEPLAEDAHPEGYETLSRDSLFRIVERVLAAFYQNRPLPTKPASSLIPEKRNRNLEIVQRYLAGERAVDLAQEFGISVRRVNRLVRRYQSRG